MLLVLNFISCGNTKSISANDNSLTESNIEDATQSDTVEVALPIIDKEKVRRDSLTQVYKDQLYNENQAKANRITTFYILAQQKFYNGEYDEALFLINRAIKVKETADILALKGSIYFGLGSIENFISFWEKALDMDKDLPIPPIPALVAELKKHGLINENPDRNFKQN